MKEDIVSEYKSVGGLRRVGAAFGYSVKGLRAAWAFEHAFRQELLVVAPGMLLALFLPVARLEKLALVVVLLLVLVVELLNSAIEAVVDRISLAHHPLSGRAKDLGSAAVLLAIAIAALTWGMLLAPLFMGLWAV
ncbi:diacylglycerol kinase [Massilia oculi]|uniref:diacylglycerol kinase n=1 Tax=Massilia oculi TaxID=945844 RepID=UPI001AAFB2B1